jgi:hypothetical protein
MSFTIFGLAVFLIGLILLFAGDFLSMFVFVIGASLMGGSSAIQLTAIGHSSVQPTYLALGFLILRAVVPGSGCVKQAPQAIERNLWLVGYCLYSAATAFILPRLFSHKILVDPLLPNAASLFQTVPLRLTAQNLTTAVYLLGDVALAVLASIAAMRPRSLQVLVPAICVVGWLHIGFGLFGLALSAVHMEGVLSFIRNGGYAQLNQAYGGFVRIQGIFPEASTYAAYGFTLFVFTCELWLRNVRVRWTGPVTAAMFAVLVMSTSSTAYLALIAYAAVLAFRWLVFGGSLPGSKAVPLIVGVLASSVLALALVAVFPKAASAAGEMLSHMTVKKLGTDSGAQRLFWAMQGWNAFKVSHGLGIGAGSFRSSSLLTAVLGSTGVLGALLLLGHLLAVFKPGRSSTYFRGATDMQSAGAAAAWAVIVGSIPLFINSPSPDPGMQFALFSGLALAWRAAPATATSKARSARPGRQRRLPALAPARQPAGR